MFLCLQVHSFILVVANATLPCWHQEPAAVRTPQINHDQLSIAKKLDGQGQTWCVCWQRRGGVVQVQVFMLHTVRLQLLKQNCDLVPHYWNVCQLCCLIMHV